MKISGNTILITGGGTGIGRGLAEALLAAGNHVIIAGRRQEVLNKVVADNPGMAAMTLNVDDAEAIKAFAEEVVKAYPALNVVINNAGIMRPENLLEPAHLEDAEAIITTNLLGPIRLNAALLAHLQPQSEATLINVSSGLAFVPLVLTPTYSATKAAMHSYSETLRAQLAETNIQVIEIVPPGVQTDLMGGANDERFMPLGEFITETMSILKTQPKAKEVCVERVKMLRLAAANGKFDETFQMLNQH